MEEKSRGAGGQGGCFEKQREDAVSGRRTMCLWKWKWVMAGRGEFQERDLPNIMQFP